MENANMLHDTPSDTEAIGRRIILLRRALGLNQAEFARLIEELPQKVNNWEKGNNRPFIDSTYKICSATGITSDWIYWNDERGVSFNLMSKIRKIADEDKNQMIRAS